MPPRPVPVARRLLLLAALALSLAFFSVAAFAQFGFGASGGGDNDKGVLASLISRALSTPATRVSIGDIEGALSSDAVIRDIRISDRDGVWLRLDRARIVWRRLALLQRRLEIDRLEVGTLEWLRKPIPAETPVEGENQPLLPDLPVKVEVKAFELNELRLGEPLLGTEARLTASGSARLGNDPSEGLQLTLGARRLDQAGTYEARLNLVPQGQQLTLALTVDEPAGGLVARAASIPGLPPVQLKLNGEGTLDRFAAELAFSAGPEIGANGTATLTRDGSVRRLQVDLRGEIGGLLPGVAAPVFAGTTRLTGQIGFGEGGAITITDLDLVAAAARLDVDGTIGANGQADLRVTATNLPTANGRTAAGAAEIEQLAFEARVQGPITAPNVDANLTLREARLPIGRIGRAEASFRIAPAGTEPGGATRLAVTGDGRVTGLALADPALARAVGDRIALTVRGTANTAAVLDLETLLLTTPTATATYSGRLASDALRGRASLEAGSLRPFSGLVGLDLSGGASVSAALEGTPRANRFNATLDGRATGFGTGIGPVDGLFGGPVTLGGTLRVEPTGGYGFENLRLVGEGATVTLNGMLAQESADLRLLAAIPDLRRLDERLTGRAEVTAEVTGGIQRPNVRAQAAVADATMLGRLVPRLVLGADLRNVTGALMATVSLDGIVDGKPARGGFRVARPEGGGYRLDALDLSVGSATLRGGVALNPGGIATGQVALDAPDLSDLSALLLTEAAGSLRAQVALDGREGRQDAQVRAEAREIRAYGVTLNRLEADLRATDLYRQPQIAGTATIDTVVIGEERISQIRLSATGTPAGSDLTLTAEARGFSLDAAARVVPAEPIRIELTRLVATRGGQRLALAAPATLTVRDGGVAASGLALAIGGGRLALDGFVGPSLDLRLDAQRVPLSAADLVSPGLDLGGTLDGTARLGGTVASPSGEFRFRLRDVTAPPTRAARLPAIDALLTGRLADGRVVLDGSTLEAGRQATLRVEGSAPLGGTGPLDLAVKGRLDAAALNGFLRTTALDLSGPVELDLRIGGTLARPEATIDARAPRFATGQAVLDALLGGRLAVNGTVLVPPAGGYAARDLRIGGQNVTARIDGRVTPDAADLTATATAPDLKRVDGRLTGRAELTARVTGTLAHPDATLRLTVTDASALGRPIPRLVVDAVARDLLGALDARVTLDGEVDRRPARGFLRVARPAAGGLVLENLDLAVGSARISGGVAFDANFLGQGRLAVNAPNLDDLSPLLLTKATGSVTLDVTLDVKNGGQDARILADLDRVNVYGLSISKADVALTLTDIYRRPVISGRVAVDEASFGGETIRRIRLTAQGNPAGSDVTLTASARGFDLDAKARVVPGERTRIEIGQFAASRGGQRIALARPATVTVADGAAEIRNLALAFGQGRLSLEGTVGSRLDLSVEARSVPLSAAEIFAPGLGVGGTLDGTARITGTAAAPIGEYRVRIGDLTAPAIRDAGLPRIDVTASGRLTGERATIDATVSAGRAGSLTVTGSVPLGSGAIDLAIRGTLDAGAASSGLLAAGGRRLAGRVSVDARVGGTLASPQASGSATLAGGSFSDASQGIQLSNISARLVASGDAIRIENAAATTRNGGVVRASGRIALDPGAGFPGEIRITGRNAELVRSGLVTAVADLNLTISGPLARRPRVSGQVNIVSADVTVPERLPGTLEPLPGTRHVNPTRTTRARLALENRQKGANGRAAPAFDAVLDIALNTPGRIVVRGRGLNAELGGSLRLTGTLSNPIPNGAFNLRRGTFDLLTTRLNFTRGNLTFRGSLTPELDFQANTNAGGAAITVSVTGPANDPAFTFTSSPDLPQDEVLSRLLFNSPSGQLSAFQALALAQAAAQFSGGGEGAFEGLRRSLGLDALDIGLGQGGGVGVGLQRALGNRVSVGVRTGATAAQTGIGVDVRVTDEIRIQGEVGATGGSSVGIGAQYEW